MFMPELWSKFIADRFEKWVDEACTSERWVAIEPGERRETMETDRTYIGAKIIKARPMSAYQFAEANKKPSPAASDVPGYQVTYPDGYVSWSPKDVFEEAYRLVSDREKAML